MKRKDEGMSGCVLRTTSRKSFTLLELLVVVAVIAVLIAVLLPAFHRARRNALLLSCGNRLKQWGTVLMEYAVVNRDYFPCTGRLGSSWWNGGSEYGGYRTVCTDFVELIYPDYFTVRDMFYCPLDRGRSYLYCWRPWLEFKGISYAYLGSYGRDNPGDDPARANRCKTLTDPLRGLMGDEQGWKGGMGWYYNHTCDLPESWVLAPSTVSVLYTDGHVQLWPVNPRAYMYNLGSLPGL